MSDRVIEHAKSNKNKRTRGDGVVGVSALSDDAVDRRARCR